MNLIFLGLPAAGKGTQAKLISQEYNLTHISTGDVLRKAVRENPHKNKKIKKYLDAGQLVPDELVINIVREKMEEEDLRSGLVFDGFPRTLRQAKALTTMFTEMGKTLNLAIYIEADEEEVVQRISGRRVCPKCGATYHLKHNPPQKEGYCDKCGAELIQRSDDKEDTVRKRIRVNKDLLDELIDYYQEKGVLKKVVSEGGIDEVFQRVKETIEVNIK